MNRVTITLTIDVPDGVRVTPSVDYGAVPARAAGPTGPTPAAGPPPAAGGWVCPEHGTSKVVPAGTSKKTGKEYKAFTVCAEQGCDEKPPRAGGSGRPPPVGPAGAEQFDDLPW